MPRVKRGVTTNRKHKKLFSFTEGFRGKRRNLVKLAANAMTKAGQNAYVGRKLKKRQFHQLWTTRINAACREEGVQYSRFIYGLELYGSRVNRKMLSELATNHPEVFKKIVAEVKAILPPAGQAPDLEALKKRFAKGKKVEKMEEAAEEKPVKAKVEKKAAPKKSAKAE